MTQTDTQTDAAPMETSNAVVLSPRQALVAGALVLAALAAAGPAWKQAEPFAPGRDFRLPYPLSEDYWLYDRWADRAAERADLLVVGDSVVWGHFVAPDQTLSHHLGGANLGVDGTHPAALAGLVRWYGRGIAGRRVVLHCNPLWMVSKRRDLQVAGKESRLNHPRLVAQLRPAIPGYDAKYSERISICVERVLGFRNLARHVQWSRFGGADLAAWTVRHPRRCAAGAVAAGPDLSDRRPVKRPVSWLEKGIGRQDFPWVQPDESLQWRFFVETLERLRGRGNRVFVVVGPLNEHLLTDASRRRYAAVKDGMLRRLEGMGVPCAAPAPLPSAEYADASHPLAAGYARLAEMLRADEAFAAFDTPETQP